MSNTADTKSDEWVSLTSEEELLDQINELKTDLKACHQSVRDLEARNIALEKERTSSLNELKCSKTTLDEIQGKLEDCIKEKGSIEEELHDLQGTSEAQLVSMEELLSANRDQLDESRDKINNLETELKTIQERYLEETTEAGKTKESFVELKTKFLKMQAWSKVQEEAIIKSRKELKEALNELDTTKSELSKVKKTLDDKNTELELANTSLGTVAVLAEDRKDKGVSLDRMVAKHKHALAAADNNKAELEEKVTLLENELSNLNAASAGKISELEGSVVDLEKALEEAVVKDYTLQIKDSELQTAQEKITEFEASNEDLKSNNSILDKELGESHMVEKNLRKEIEQIKIAHKQHLDNIREALGVKKPNSNQCISFENDPVGFIINLFSVRLVPPKFRF